MKKLCALCLVFVMCLSLASTTAFAVAPDSSGDSGGAVSQIGKSAIRHDPDDAFLVSANDAVSDGWSLPAMMSARVIRATGSNQHAYVFVIWDDNTVVEMPEQFLLDYATKMPLREWQLVSNTGYVNQARAVVNYLFDNGIVTGGGDHIGYDVTRVMSVDTADRTIIPLTLILEQCTGREFETEVLGVADLKVVYDDENWTAGLSCMTFYRCNLVETTMVETVAPEASSCQNCGCGAAAI